MPTAPARPHPSCKASSVVVAGVTVVVWASGGGGGGGDQRRQAQSHSVKDFNSRHGSPHQTALHGPGGDTATAASPLRSNTRSKL